MRTISARIASRAAAALRWSLPITGFPNVLGGVIFVALLHNPIQALSANISPGQSVTLAWNQSTDPTVAGYNLYYGEAGGALTNEISAGTATSVTISGLTPGTTYYFAATTYTFSGVESGFSSEASYTVPTPPSEVQISVTPTGQSVLSVTGPAGQTNDIQATQDLETWTVIGSATVGASGSVDFADTNAASFSRRFYRTQRQP
jgi:hypothetical protein